MRSLFFLLFSLFNCCLSSTAQKPLPVDRSELETIIQKSADSLSYYYVNLEMGHKIGDYLKSQFDRGVYEEIHNPDSLAKKLTADLRSINGDLHLSVQHRRIKNNQNGGIKAPSNTNSKGRKTNYGFRDVSILEHNIGYLKIQHFSNWSDYSRARIAATNAIQFLKNTDAIIFDVRDNRGGVPYLAAYMISYLFDGDPVHLAQYHHRYSGYNYGVYTEVNLKGNKLPDVPVFILVNDRTASAAEEFAYWSKHQGRTTVVGDTTMGAGYGVMMHHLNERFAIYISSEEDINPITKTNFELVGVLPDITVGEKDALEVVKPLAQKAAEKYRQQRLEEEERIMNALQNISDIDSTIDLYHLVKRAYSLELIDESKINGLGYVYLTNRHAPKIAQDIFAMNIELHPQSPNVYDSYAEALIANGKMKLAEENLEIAVRLGTQQNHPSLHIFVKNLEHVRKEME